MKALDHAIQQRDGESIDVILTTVSNLYLEDRFKDEALFIAAEKGFPEAVKILLQKGAHPNARGTGVDTEMTLHKAAQGGHVQTIKALLQGGADPNVKDRDGNTSLHRAAESESSEVFMILLENGADANATNALRATPLHWTVARGLRSISKLLIQNGTDPNIKNTYGETASMKEKERFSGFLVRDVKFEPTWQPVVFGRPAWRRSTSSLDFRICVARLDYRYCLTFDFLKPRRLEPPYASTPLMLSQ